jgi:hypothetical protein
MGLSELKVQIQQFSSNKYVQGSKEFVQSNSIVAKFAFLILVLIVFMMLLGLGSAIMSLFFRQNHNPILIDGMIDSKQMMIIPQNPSKTGAKPIYRSNNEREGLEFTWSVWIFVNDFTSDSTDKYKHVFHKGDTKIDPGSGIFMPNNGPGLYITPIITDPINKRGDMAGLRIVMNVLGQSSDPVTENVDIKNLPLSKWVNVIIRVTKQSQLDVYINGTLVKRHMLSGVPRQNYGDVYVSMNGGFTGNTSDLRYFESAIGTNKIQNILNSGPNQKLVVGTLGVSTTTNKYLSTRWYLNSTLDV